MLSAKALCSCQATLPFSFESCVVTAEFMNLVFKFFF